MSRQVAFLVVLFFFLQSFCARCVSAQVPGRSFLNDFCVDCHSGDKPDGALDLQSLSTKLDEPAVLEKWIRLFDRVNSGEMPPKDAELPSKTARVSFTRSLGMSLSKAHAAGKGTVLRRLNRREYQNTLNDLFGTNLDLVSMLPEDGRSHEFDTVGESLGLSLVHMKQYLAAIEKVLDTSIVNSIHTPESKTIRASYADMRGAEKFLGSKWLKLDDGAVVFFERNSYPTGMLREANVRTAGRYRIRVTGYAHQSDKPITFSIGATTFARGAERPTFSYHSMPPGKPTTVEIETWIDRNYMIQIEPWGIYDSYQIKRNGIKNYKGPGLAILHVEVEGPLIESFPGKGHDFVFDGLNRREVMPRNPNDRKKRYYKPIFEIESSDPTNDILPVLTRIASVAFRRPVSASEVTAYRELFDSEVATGASAEQALRAAIAAIFCSTDFLFFNEKPGQLDDFALASRLSYFLTRTAPDEQLLAAARSGTLSTDKVLLIQTERLVGHKYSTRFIEDFTDAWLDLRNIEFTTPDRLLFPEFDPFLKHSSVDETRAFFAELIQKNLPVRNLVKSDFAMLNNRLAQHYGIDGVEGPAIRPVRLPGNSLRGGVLTQSAVLKVSANGTNTSPVVRGVWVMERLLGEVSPPPPAGVPGVEPDIRGAKTLREILDKHRELDSCRACHEKIDPPGFALECFNPIGGYRDRFRSMGEGEKVNLELDGNRVRYKLSLEVDASGSLSDGRKFSGFREFRDHLADDEETLARALTKKLLTFATGREMGFSDRAIVEEIVQKTSRSNHGVRDLIRQVILSEIFRSK